MSAPSHVYEYALLRAMPRVDRGEVINVGVLLYCRALDFLDTRVHLDVDRLRALDPTVDPGPIEAALRSMTAVCSATPGSGPAGRPETGRRFRWLTAARSTVLQPGTVHTGRTSDPAAEIDHLLRKLVLPPHG